MDDDRSSVRRRCRWLQRLATVLMLGFVLALGVDAALVLRSADVGAYLAFTVPYRLPILFYLAGVWTIRSAFARLADGEVFGHVLPILLHRLGWALALGGFASVFLAQWLSQALRGIMEGPWAAFDPAAITVGLVGALLIVLADLMRRAEAMRQELDEFF